MPERLPAELPEPILEVLRAIDPLRLPQAVAIDAALNEALDAVPPSEEPRFAVEIAELILPRCLSCDVVYTFNVIELAERAIGKLHERPGDLLSRAHLIAARARTFHQSGEKAHNLALAKQHLDEAERAGAPASMPAAWAAALLDVARAAELGGTEGAQFRPEVLRAQILATTASEAATYRTLAAASAGDQDEAEPPAENAGDIEQLERILEQHQEALPIAYAPAATRLARLYLSRAAPGDGDRARHWLQAAERTFYYNPSVRLADCTRNQLAIARYFSVVTVNDPDDADYVFNKALFSLNLAYRMAADDVDLQAECFVTAARLWARRDHERAREFLTTALELPGLTPAVQASVQLEHARALARSPSDALEAIDPAIATFRVIPECEHDLLESVALKARLLVAQHIEENPRDYKRPTPRMAVELMAGTAVRREARGELHEAYFLRRQLAQWAMDAEQLAEALAHYEECRRLAQAILDRDLAQPPAFDGVDDQRRHELVAKPSAALLRTNQAYTTAVQIASIDHQVAAYCAAQLGRLDDALQWILGSRLRAFRAAGRIDTAPASAPQPADGTAVAVFIVADEGTIALVYREGAPVEALRVPLTQAQLRRMVFDRDEHTLDLGWVRLYREFLRETPFGAPPPDEHVDEPHELWWRSLKDDIERFAQYFAEPLLKALADRRIHAARLVLVPQALLSFMPMHAAELSDGSFVADHCALQVAFTPSLPCRKERYESRAAAGALIVTGNNELVYSRLEARLVASLMNANSVAVTPTVSTRAAMLDAMERADYLHFASHGVFDSSRWFDSRIDIGSGEALRLGDVAARDLSRVRLVTLSACESGVSHLAGLQEEFLGFPAIFSAAGAQAVLSTLWRVSDLSSALLLEAFYRDYLEGVHASVALNEARKWLRRVTAGELVARARAELAAPRDERRWRPVECSGVIGRFAGTPPDTCPFRSPYHWAAFTLWQAN